MTTSPSARRVGSWALAAAVACAVVAVATGRARADEPAPTPTPDAPPTPNPAPPAPNPAPAATTPVLAGAHDNGLTFAGSLQLDYLGVPTERSPRAFTLDGATVELSLKLTKDFSKNASASVKVCFACHGFEAGLAVVELRAADELRVRAGRMTPAFGAFPQRHDPANHMTSDKPLPYDMGRMLRRLDWNEGILPAPWVDNGIEIAGTHFFPAAQLDYAIYAVMGPKAGVDATDFDFVQSRAPEQYYVDNNSEPAVGGRLSGAFELGETDTMTLGVSAMAGHYDPDRKLTFAIAGGDFVYRHGNVFLRAEYLIRRTEMAVDDPTRFKYGPAADGTFSNYFLKDGFYVEGEIPLGAVTALARFDGLRRSGNVLATSALSNSSSLYRGTFALAFRVVSSMRIKTSIEYYDFSDFQNDIAVHVGLATPF
jgi:hypothetical protein